MHGPWPGCGGARAAPCSTDCTSVVLHGSVCRSYLPSAETFPLCFDEGEGRHKRLCLLSRSLPPSPSQWSFGGSRSATKMQQTRASFFMHLEPFRVRGVRVGAGSVGTDARRPPATGDEVILQLRCKRIRRSGYMMGRGLAAERS